MPLPSAHPARAKTCAYYARKKGKITAVFREYYRNGVSYFFCAGRLSRGDRAKNKEFMVC